MSYLLLILEPSGQRRERGLEGGKEAFARMLRYADSLKSRGVLIETNSLREEGTRLTLRQGRRSVVDGPFTESKELIGGYFLVSCGTRAEALALAGECPAAEWATIEVRELGPCYT